MSEQELLSQRIQYYCKLRRMSYYKLASRSTVPMSTVLHIVNCVTKNPGIFTLAKICSGLDVSMSEFFNAEEFENIEYNVE
ncbi:helix-turn-helix domain-containing protein [Clostridium sp. AN503]|jgi:transcriptional regulator with XRE-family HTH domain|uniref:helix-turn-helix domain-containing protein n=1 Tax=Clostridium sp. AN503 TaxID=3160598 RepID=UPI003459AD1A